MTNPEQFEPSQEIEHKVRSAFQIQDPDQLFIDRLQKKLTDRFKDIERSTENKNNFSRRSQWLDKSKLLFSPLAWGAIGIIFILFLVWGIKTLVPRVEPGRGIQPLPSPMVSPLPTTESTQAEGAEAAINLPTLVGMPVPWPEEVITSENAGQVTELARWGERMISGITWSPDGKTFAFASSKGINLYDSASFGEIKTIAEGEDVSPIAFSPDGTMLAGGVNGSTIKIWDVASGNELRTLDGYENFITFVAFLPDGDSLVTQANEEPIKVWDISSGQELRTLGGSNVYISAISPDGTMMATNSGGNSVQLWDIASGEELRTLAGHTDYITGVAFSPDGNTLASSSGDMTIKLWDIVKGTELTTLNVGTGFGSIIAFSPDGAILGSVDFKGPIKIWDVASGQVLRTIGEDTQMGFMTFSPDGKTILAYVYPDTIKDWEVDSGKEIHTLGLQSDVVASIAVSPDGGIVASGSNYGRIKLLDASTGQELRTLNGHKDPVNNLAFSPDGTMLASASSDKTIKLWDVASGAELNSITGQQPQGWFGGTPCVAFSPDGKILAYAAEDGQVKLWDISNHQEIRAMGGQPGAEYADLVDAIAFSPDGKILASGYASGSITLWDATSGSMLRALPVRVIRNVNNSVSMEFSQDGEILASVAIDGKIEIWDVANGNVVRTFSFPGDQEAFNVNLAISRDGDVVAAGTEAGMIKLWSIDSGQELNSFDSPASSLAFSAAGDVLVSGSWDGTVRLWGIAPSNAVQPEATTETLPLEIIPTAEPVLQATPEELGMEKITIPVLLTDEDLQPGSWSLDGNYFYYTDRGPINEAGPNQAINTLNFLDTRTGKVCPSIQETVTFTQTGWDLYKRTTWLGDNRFLYISPEGELLSINPCGDSIKNLSTSLPDSIISFNSGVKPDGSQVVIKGGQAYWLFTPSTQQALRLDLPAPETGKDTRFAWLSREDKLLSSRIEDRQGDLWIIFESIEIEKGTATPVYEVRASQQLAMQEPQVAYFELASDNEIFIPDTDSGMALIDIRSEPARQTNLFPDLFGIDEPSMESVTTWGTIRGTGGQDYHLILATGMAADGQYYIYHPESGVVDQYPLDPPFLIVFPEGDGGIVRPFNDSSPSTDIYKVILVDSNTEPFDLVVKGHLPRTGSSLSAHVLPGAKQVLFSSSQGISLVDLKSGETTNFWVYENQEKYPDYNLWITPDGKTVISFAYGGMEPGVAGRIQAMYWLRLEP